jgi:pyruvate-ferredoxin/flavodoxin oxidoreductase
MACRATGCALLASNSVQEAQDMALIAQAATLAGRIPVIHFFDGFRTSHEVAKIVAVEPDTVRAMIDDTLVAAHRARALSPEHPVLRGTAQNPDVFFQSRARQPLLRRLPGLVQRPWTASARSPAATTALRLRGRAGCRAGHRGDGLRRRDRGETVEHLTARGEKVGLLKLRLFRPWPASACWRRSRPARVAVLDRCKEPGADGEPSTRT